MKNILGPLAVAGISTFAAAMSASADVKLGTPFSDHMVLQRDRAVPVWGSAEPGEAVSVSFAGQTLKAVAKADGSWRVDLAALAASKEGRTLTAAAASGRAEVADVLVGEVWFASGQSNMECPIWSGDPRFRDANGAMMINSTYRPYIRWVRNEHKWSAKPAKIDGTAWRDYSPESFMNNGGVRWLSAVAYYYALELYGALDVPIGIIDSTWGGTNIDAWTPRCGYEGHPELKDVAEYPVTDKWDKSMSRGPVSGSNQQPTVLWNGMVDAWTPFAIRGFIWYQGCHNAGEAGRYCAKMHALYDGWSKAFENPGLRLYFAELAPFAASWFEIQQAQKKFAAEEGNAAIAVLADVGNLRDIHPNNKEIVAKRLALHALKNDYGFGKVRPNSPTLKSWKVENGAMVLSFNDARGWYVYEADRSVAPNFEIAGPDNKFVPAKLANVDGNGRVRGADLVVSAEDVKEPCRLRYLYKSPFTGTLYNDVSLPLGSFEVDARTNKPTRVGAPVRLGDAEQAKELEGYRKIQTLDIPVRPNYAQNPPPRPEFSGEFSRVAYLLELESMDGTVDWVLTSMDAPESARAVSLGVPCRAGERIQGRVSGLTVRSNRSNVKPVTNYDGGSVEFWAPNYGQRKMVDGIGGDDTRYDFNDSPNLGQGAEVGYGSMQVHDWKSGATIWALNNFNGDATCDIGIGNNEDGDHPDWTFMHNASRWRTRRLSIFVQPRQ